MKAKEYIKLFIKMIKEDQVDPKQASINILDMLFMETKMLADKNRVFLEADFVELIAQQNSKWRIFARRMNLDPDGFAFYIIQRNPELWEKLKKHRKFKDIADRIIKKLEKLEAARKKRENNGN